jgi:hypothetical protein
MRFFEIKEQCASDVKEGNRTLLMKPISFLLPASELVVKLSRHKKKLSADTKLAIKT